MGRGPRLSKKGRENQAGCHPLLSLLPGWHHTLPATVDFVLLNCEQVKLLFISDLVRTTRKVAQGNRYREELEFPSFFVYCIK